MWSEQNDIDPEFIKLMRGEKTLKSVEDGIKRINESLASQVERVFNYQNDIVEKYNELIMSVGRCFPNESRHETALRYIKQTEERACAYAGQTKDVHDLVIAARNVLLKFGTDQKGERIDWIEWKDLEEACDRLNKYIEGPKVA